MQSAFSSLGRAVSWVAAREAPDIGDGHGTSTKAAQPPLRAVPAQPRRFWPRSPRPRLGAMPHGDSPSAPRSRQDAGLPLALCTNWTRDKASPKPSWAALSGGAARGQRVLPSSGCRSTGTSTPGGWTWEVAPQPGCGSWCEQGLGLAQPSSTGGQCAHLLGWESTGAHCLQLPSVAF